MKRILDKKEDYGRIADFVLEQIGHGRKTDNITAIGLENDGHIVAGVLYGGFNGNCVEAGIAGIGKHWLTPDFLWYMFYYPFAQMGVQRITVCVETNNLQSQRFVEKLGFELEVSMKRAGKFGDLLVYRMFRENCKHLERRHVRTIA